KSSRLRSMGVPEAQKLFLARFWARWGSGLGSASVRPGSPHRLSTFRAFPDAAFFDARHCVGNPCATTSNDMATYPIAAIAQIEISFGAVVMATLRIKKGAALCSVEPALHKLQNEIGMPPHDMQAVVVEGLLCIPAQRNHAARRSRSSVIG